MGLVNLRSFADACLLYKQAAEWGVAHSDISTITYVYINIHRYMYATPQLQRKTVIAKILSSNSGGLFSLMYSLYVGTRFRAGVNIYIYIYTHTHTPDPPLPTKIWLELSNCSSKLKDVALNWKNPSPNSQ